MSEEKFTPGEWFIGNVFNYEGANNYVKIFADGEREPIAEVLVKNRSFGKEYHNANLIATAPEMYWMLEELKDDLKALSLNPNVSEQVKASAWLDIQHIERVQKKARGEATESWTEYGQKRTETEQSE